MRILSLEPYYGGSHKAFLDGWSKLSRHKWTLLDLPAYKWKWRMRHAAVTFAEQVERRVASGETWDLVLCSDMLNLAEFLGLAPAPVRALPTVVYFHENQLTYPVRNESERDYHFVLTNMTTALAATRVWFNSAFHRDEFLSALPAFLKRMPDHQPLHAVERIRTKSSVQPPGIEAFAVRRDRRPGPLRILWAARWEHDKNPECFFEALDLLQSRGLDFRISVIGEQFRDSPSIFEQAKTRFRTRIDRWGFQPTREAYRAALCEADVVVSTADHEFFGLGVVEAVAAGAAPLVPRRLAYPEVLGELEPADSPKSGFFYAGGSRELADRLGDLCERLEQGDLWNGDPGRGGRAMARFAWDRRAKEFDNALQGA